MGSTSVDADFLFLEILLDFTLAADRLFFESLRPEGQKTAPGRSVLTSFGTSAVASEGKKTAPGQIFLINRHFRTDERSETVRPAVASLRPVAEVVNSSHCSLKIN